MRVDRLTRVNEELRREIGQFLYRLMANDPGFDLGAVTVTHVIISSDLRTARVLVSIRDHQDRREAMLKRLQSRHAEIQADIAHKVALKYTPRLTFQLDHSLEEGDRVLGLLATMENSTPTDGTPI